MTGKIEKLYMSAMNDYICKVSLRQHPTQTKVIEETKKHPMARMMSSGDQIQMLQCLMKQNNYKKVIDVGVFTGYSSLSFALAVPEDGIVQACDVSDEFMKIAAGYWKEAGVDSKVKQRLGPAVTSLEQILSDEGEGSYDLVYIDADKENYTNYYKLARKLVRSGGLIAVDNVLWSGKVADDSINDSSTVAIREVNEYISKDTGVNISLLTVGDGIFLAFVI